ncbi:MAG: hypothetical protein ISR65_19415 [Bacteriovoracaceae bacterium]|nr:hypothetical protein [Bacteriovoracaceae bacterium]
MKDVKILEGVMAPFRWNRHGEIVQFLLQGYDEQEYVINKKMAYDLGKLLNRAVQIKGTIFPLKSGRLEIDVINYCYELKLPSSKNRFPRFDS